MIVRVLGGYGARTCSMLAAALLALLVVYFLTIDLGYRFLQKYPPDWTAAGWARMLGCILVALLATVALNPARARRRGLPDEGASGAFGWLCLASAALLVGTALIVAAAPGFLYSLVNEHAPAEYIAEAVLAGSFVLGLAMMRSPEFRRAPADGIVPAWAVIGAAAAAIFLLLMEEISWGQKFLTFETPAAFAENLQNETNFHNFHTHRFEFVFYSSAILAFVILPFAWPRNPAPILRAIGFYVPPRWFAVAGAPLCTYMFEMWNIVPFQVYFFIGLFVLAFTVADTSHGKPQIRVAAMFMLVAMLVSQALFLLNGYGFVRHHDLTEVRELLIAVMIFAYVLWLRGSLAELRGPPVRSPS